MRKVGEIRGVTYIYCGAGTVPEASAGTAATAATAAAVG